MECSLIMKRSSKEKLQIIQRLIAGESIKRVAKQCGLGVPYLSVLYDRYKKYGEEGLCRKKNNYLSPEEKERLIRLHEEKGVSLRSIYTDYDISPSVFKRLLIKVRTQGYSSLYESKKRGRPPKDHSMARPKKKEPQTELEKLQAENLRLRAENALLKKVQTLVEEQKAQARRSGQKPSTN